MKIIRSCFIILILSINISCNRNTGNPDIIPDAPANTATPVYTNVAISTDKAVYNPGDVVTFSIDYSTLPTSTKVRYKNSNTVVSEADVTGATWTWKTPSTDYKGYLAEVYGTNNGNETIYATVGIDVSSSWTKFPRYGFLSGFSQLSDDNINAVIANLNKYHINGLQFYDWQNKHHKPLPLVNSAPANTWKDIINRDIYLSTIQKYITSAHAHNMKAMFYDLIYGAWESGEADGVQKEWSVYKDNTHTNKDFHPLSSPFLSNIYLLDPSNTGWQQYFINEIKTVYQYLNFDGFHMDQLGDRGSRYKYDGSFLNLSQAFKPFIDAVHTADTQKFNVMNAVQQYGQQSIAGASSDFLYTEVWSPSDSYGDLATLIKQNNTLSNNTKNTVLAAYMNYDLANNKGYFNTPSVLMTNSVIFAFGGAHLELGEHMLGKEYFPNDNLSMKDDLKSSLVNYYDFLVAYQNLLRDGGSFNSIDISSVDKKISLEPWPASAGNVAVFGKKVNAMQIIHFINFTNSKTQNWRDNTGIQVSPLLVKDAKLVFTSTTPVKKMWVASPDIAGGASRTLNFAQIGTKVSFILPDLKYWDMVVVEY
ncbi:MAG: glycoside hydrolase family 66 protein [Paludibacter sp.]|nr:glycoside hydrolase family 66 protein [Paludibacter sp.]